MYQPGSIISNRSFELVDVTMRDGALGRKFPYSLDQLKQYLRILESIGINYAEIGFINGPGKWSEGEVDSPNYDINPKLNDMLHAESAIKLWSMIDSDNQRLDEKHVHANENSLVRLTADLDKIHLLEAKINICKQKGVPFSVNLKHTGSYEPGQVEFMAKYAENQGAQIFYIVDTAGTMVPSQIAQITRQLKNLLTIDLGFHGHDSLGFAAANSLTAIEEGCKYIDVSLCGIGAGGGNAITETFALLTKGEQCDWNKLIEAGELLNIPPEYRQLQERIFWGFIGCNTTVKKDLTANNSASAVAQKAMGWKYGEILSKGEHTTLRLLNRPEPAVIKIADQAGKDKLVNEIKFLVRNKSKYHYNFLPEIRSHAVVERYAYYSMPYMPGPLLRDYIYSEPDLSMCERQIKKTIGSLNKLHSHPGTIKSAEFSRHFYTERLQKRWKKLLDSPRGREPLITIDSIQGISSAEAESVFSRLAQGATLAIDDRTQDFSFAYLIESLGRFDDVLEVPQASIRMIHGDPHYGNVLLHDDNPILLDPNGFMDGGDIAYDFGKLLVSHDWHDLSMMHLLEPVKVSVSKKGIAVTNNRRYKSSRIEKRHKALRAKATALLKEEVLPLYENKDPLLLQRIELLLLIHQFSFSPTLIKEKPEPALHVLLNSISDYMTLEEKHHSGEI